MQAHIKLGQIRGIKIGLHFSWIFIALLIALSLLAHFGVTNPQWSRNTVLLVSIVAAVLFFATIVAHELSHALVAQSCGLTVNSITLFAFGGVAQIEKDAADAKTEFWMAIVGPITSLIIGLVCLAITWALGWSPDLMSPQPPLIAMLMWLGLINIALAVFNMVPGYPLDGGRVLRAIIWWASGNVVKATRIASRIGQLIALGFIVIGIYRFFQGAGFSALWLSFIGWFLLDAASANQAQVEMGEMLKGKRVGDLMDPDCDVLTGRENIQTFVDQYLLRTGHRCFVVEEQSRIVGLITPHEIKSIPPAQWSYTTVDQVMRPLEELRTATGNTPAIEALEVMGREDVNQLPVVNNGQLVGMISRSNILSFLQTRAEILQLEGK